MKPFAFLRAALPSKSVKLGLIFALTGILMFAPATAEFSHLPVTSSNTWTLTGNGKISRTKIASPARRLEMT